MLQQTIPLSMFHLVMLPLPSAPCCLVGVKTEMHDRPLSRSQHVRKFRPKLQPLNNRPLVETNYAMQKKRILWDKEGEDKKSSTPRKVLRNGTTTEVWQCETPTEVTFPSVAPSPVVACKRVASTEVLTAVTGGEHEYPADWGWPACRLCHAPGVSASIFNSFESNYKKRKSLTRWFSKI